MWRTSAGVAGLLIVQAGLLCAHSAPQVELRRDDVYLLQGREWKRLTQDGIPKSYVSLSPDHRRIAYWQDAVQGSTFQPFVVVLDRSGHVRARFLPPDSVSGDSTCASVLNLEWIDDQLLGIECHENPSRSSYTITDAASGKPLHTYAGYGFSWSPDHRTLAHVGSIIHFASDKEHSEYLQLGETTVYAAHPPNLDDLTTIHNFLTPFTWTRDSRDVLFVDSLDPDDRLLLVAVDRDRERVSTCELPRLQGVHPYRGTLQINPDQSSVAVLLGDYRLNVDLTGILDRVDSVDCPVVP